MKPRRTRAVPRLSLLGEQRANYNQPYETVVDKNDGFLKTVLKRFFKTVPEMHLKIDYKLLP